MVLSNVIVDVTIPRRAFVFGNEADCRVEVTLLLMLHSTSHDAPRENETKTDTTAGHKKL